jgi:protoporphyrin/coproporphyrin ferrochelatase
MSKTAVVLCNLGGPDSLAAVEPFLFNLFNDRAIIGLPQPLRWLVAKLIARRRAPVARAIYEHLGGASPLLANTQSQAVALAQALGEGHRVFVAMRYWPPFSDAAAAQVKGWQPDDIVVVPLYPQFSTTTTGSSLSAWRAAAAAAGLTAPTRVVCCYPDDPGFIAALAETVRHARQRWPAGTKQRILFSAHGLPRKIVAAGDPYQFQVERTAAALRTALAEPGLDSVVCYQSRVGPLAWIGPATDAEIRRAGAAGVGLIVVPVAFVSEHSETLVELDIDYRHLAAAAGVPTYVRVPTVGVAPAFIAGVAALVRQAPAGPSPAGGVRLCPAEQRGCVCAASPP